MIIYLIFLIIKLHFLNFNYILKKHFNFILNIICLLFKEKINNFNNS
jgi:hypothetical protein